MQDCVCQTPVREVVDLKERLIDTWNDLSQSTVDDADEWHKRLQSCVNEKGGHFEHLLQYFGLSANWLCGQTACFISLYNKKCNLFGKVIICATDFFWKVVQ